MVNQSRTSNRLGTRPTASGRVDRNPSIFIRLTMFSLLSCALIGGCSKAVGPETIPVTGTITMDGAPVAEAVVVFTPATQGEDSQLAAQAETDSEGRFELSTYVAAISDYQPGIVTGDYKVTVTKLKLPDNMAGQPKHLLPKKYRESATTPLDASVTEGPAASFDFNLEKK